MKKKPYKIELSDEAEIDFDKSYEYYTLKSEKTANAFYKQIDSGLRKIGQSPTSHQKVYHEIRKFVLKKFPFIIYYQIEEPIIKVIAIFHTSRNPELWEERK
jgi:toxin ParE1/3/4